MTVIPSSCANAADDLLRLTRRLEKLKQCFALCGIINSTLDLPEVLERIMSTSRRAVGAETCSLLLVDESPGPGRGELVFRVAQGPMSDFLRQGFRLRRGEGLAGWACEHGKPLLIADAYADARFNPEVDRRTGYRTKTILTVPLAVRGRVIGVSQLINKEDGTPFDATDLETFSLICDQAAVAIDNARLHAEMLQKQRMDFDMELAANVQQGFIPRRPPEFHVLDVAGVNHCCDETGGDYYDFIVRRDATGASTHLVVMVGDVSGHGIPAALLMASARAFLRARLMAPGGIEEALRDVNRLLSEDLGMTGRFMTLFALEIDVTSRDIRWSRAGHDPALIYDPAADAFQELGGKGIPLGIDPGWVFCSDQMQALAAGSVVVLGTDGIWETRDPAGEMYGKDRLKNVVRTCCARTAPEIADAVMADLAAYRCGLTRRDDETVVVIKIKET
ncbi:SpoIIE family protein phosphatase [Desulfovibrio sulfodismutans]|uniref:SpoIIE family protein phosphatase n=1 Tax=Desulfolutivibrio sulfodismutans TaxID=63561 RepID=A0A7K3NPD3_9BACT|nr:GAF domain-containing SpoIIE family protein phosphatase [Desulfolutivibrio sulfodismutans]NDY58056.1 SpoIIE family protein phosphatase [Desulfolutivibrio sulfodismutans]QLA13651.1 SpoIIE family protein phosphatase [Desulfolutivibrio sulfodismutans DSM 3696]